METRAWGFVDPLVIRLKPHLQPYIEMDDIEFLKLETPFYTFKELVGCG